MCNFKILMAAKLWREMIVDGRNTMVNKMVISVTNVAVYVTNLCQSLGQQQCCCNISLVANSISWSLFIIHSLKTMRSVDLRNILSPLGVEFVEHLLKLFNCQTISGMDYKKFETSLNTIER